MKGWIEWMNEWTGWRMNEHVDMNRSIKQSNKRSSSIHLFLSLQFLHSRRSKLTWWIDRRLKMIERLCFDCTWWLNQWYSCENYAWLHVVMCTMDKTDAWMIAAVERMSSSDEPSNQWYVDGAYKWYIISTSFWLCQTNAFIDKSSITSISSTNWFLRPNNCITT